jgi:hypothetical protein
MVLALMGSRVSPKVWLEYAACTGMYNTGNGGRGPGATNRVVFVCSVELLVRLCSKGTNKAPRKAARLSP